MTIPHLQRGAQSHSRGVGQDGRDRGVEGCTGLQSREHHQVGRSLFHGVGLVSDETYAVLHNVSVYSDVLASTVRYKLVAHVQPASTVLSTKVGRRQTYAVALTSTIGPHPRAGEFFAQIVLSCFPGRLLTVAVLSHNFFAHSKPISRISIIPGNPVRPRDFRPRVPIGRSQTPPVQDILYGE
jgi:hypothetical protein